jgi:hypothetical protein
VLLRVKVGGKYAYHWALRRWMDIKLSFESSTLKVLLVFGRSQFQISEQIDILTGILRVFFQSFRENAAIVPLAKPVSFGILSNSVFINYNIILRYIGLH